MTDWEKWQTENKDRLRAVAKTFGGNSWDDLLQLILINSWRAALKYEDFHRTVGTVIRNTLYDFLRLQRTRKKRFRPLLEIEDFALDQDSQIDWAFLFDVAHETENLTAARFMRAVVNPDVVQLQAEDRVGGFRWSIVYKIAGLNKKARKKAFDALKQSLATYNLEDLLVER